MLLLNLPYVHGTILTRANAVLLLLKKEVELCKLQADIREQVRTWGALGPCILGWSCFCVTCVILRL